MPLGEKHLLGRVQLLEREVRRDDGRELSPLDRSHELAEEMRRSDRGTRERQVVEVERAEVQRDDRTGDCAGAAVASAASQEVD